jgi:hypothetical protein
MTASSSPSHVCCWHFSDIEAVRMDVRFRAPFGRLSSVLNSTADAHTKSMITFESGEHRHDGLTPSQDSTLASDGSLGGGTGVPECIMSTWEA